MALHASEYDISKAVSSMVPAGGPVLCRDEMEEWSASEANLFEEALDKYGKDFIDIRQDFVSMSQQCIIHNHHNTADNLSNAKPAVQQRHPGD